jgi:hypothetical protein
VAESPDQSRQHNGRPEARDLTDPFHHVSHANIPASAGKHDDSDKDDQTHFQSPTVRGLVPLTRATPPQIKTTPAHRIGEIISCSRK